MNKELLKELKKMRQAPVVIAFSGGVDSSLLLAYLMEADKESKEPVYAVTFVTKLHPPIDEQIAKNVAKQLGAIHKVIVVDELDEAGIQDNPVDRCYRCKKQLFIKLKKLAHEVGAASIVEGTNADDLNVYRPGLKAIKELNIESPLAKLKITKEQVRNLANELGISVANRPSTPCLATRFPYGATLSYEWMEVVGRQEEWLRSLGCYNVRIRVHDKIARLEVDEIDWPKIINSKEQIVKRLKEEGFDYVTLDLEGFRSGSMDLHVK